MSRSDRFPPEKSAKSLCAFWTPHDPTYYYLGSERAKTTAGDFVSVGDLGWMDEEGYLFLADRRTDLIITGGAQRVSRRS